MIATRTRSSLRDYFNRKLRERVELRSTLDAIALSLPDTVIFGGMLREFGLGNVRDFSSDIDLVSNASRADIFSAVSCFSPKINRFGGMRFIAGKRLFDIWALEDTWAFRENLVLESGFKALFQTTFFGIDAAFFHLTTKKFECSPAHLRGVKEKILEINLRENPAPEKMIRRALKMARIEGLSIDVELGVYIVDHYRNVNDNSSESFFIQALKEHVNKGEQDPFRFIVEDERIQPRLID